MTDLRVSERLRERGNNPCLASDANGELMLGFADEVHAIEEELRSTTEQYLHWEKEIKESDAVIIPLEDAVVELGTMWLMVKEWEDCEGLEDAVSDITKALVRTLTERYERDYETPKTE